MSVPLNYITGSILTNPQIKKHQNSDPENPQSIPNNQNYTKLLSSIRSTQRNSKDRASKMRASIQQMDLSWMNYGNKQSNQKKIWPSTQPDSSCSIKTFLLLILIVLAVCILAFGSYLLIKTIEQNSKKNPGLNVQSVNPLLNSSESNRFGSNAEQIDNVKHHRLNLQ